MSVTETDDSVVATASSPAGKASLDLLARPEKGNDTVASALHAQSPVIGIAPEPRRHLPSDLMRTAGHHPVLGEIDERAVSVISDRLIGRRLHAPRNEASSDREIHLNNASSQGPCSPRNIKRRSQSDARVLSERSERKILP